jgi:hypothetical protein
VIPLARLRKAMGATAHLILLGVTLVAAAALRSPPLLALGLAAFVVLVGWDLATPELAAASPAGRAAASALLRAKAELARAIAEAPPSMKADLARVTAAAACLDVRAAELLGRVERLSAFLERAAATSAGEARARAITDIAAERERTDADLGRIVATYESLAPSVVRLAAMEASAAFAASGAAAAELEQVELEMAALEEGLEVWREVSKS